MGHDLAYRTKVFQTSVFIGSLILLKILFKICNSFLNWCQKVDIIVLVLVNSQDRLCNMSSSVLSVASMLSPGETAMVLPQVLLKIYVTEEFRYLLCFVYSLKLSTEHSTAFKRTFQQLFTVIVCGKSMTAYTYRCTCTFFRVLPDVSATVLL